MDRLIEGYREFRRRRWPEERSHYAELSKGQRPEFLVVACSDSRADPATIFSARPGELFVIRNVAAIVPPYEPEETTHHGTSAAIAFAVLQLPLRGILVMGHAQCGGIAAALDNRIAENIPFLSAWIDLLEPARQRTAQVHDHAARHIEMERDAVRLSLERLMTFPFVAERVRARALSLYGARFAIAGGQLEVLDPASGNFVPVEAPDP
ncbi:MAG TPA: carbonic anhydrase [Rhizomicrobium sp.]|jgi:carbonic anhydrase|nr:carbonic anhydrase [Rhizomicrobium sp.]